MFLLLHGPDDFTACETLDRLRASRDFGYSVDTFAGAEADLSAVLASCDTVPFLSAERLVVVDGQPKRRRGATEGEAAEAREKPAGRGRKKKSADGPDPRAFTEGLAAYVARLPETTVLVVIVDELLDEHHPLMQAAKAHGRAQACVPPRGPQLESWLARRASATGATLAPDAARLLASEVGEDLRLLANELDKLSTYAGTGGTITVEDVRALSPASSRARVFDLTDALARRDRKRALALLHELLAAGESPLGIIALTAYQTRTLIQVRALADRGLRAHQIAQAAGMPPFVAEKSLALARQFSAAQLEAAHRLLLDVDTGLKRSRMTPEMALDLLVLEFGGAR
jgi:DNA polymerase III subunit delta